MKKYLFTYLIVILPIIANCQNNESKYLEGAVPEINGKIVFTDSITTTTPISGERLFPLMESWAKERYSEKDDLKNRVLLIKPETNEIVCSGETYLVFQKSSLALDRAKMSYQIILKTRDNSCDITIRNIRYTYSDDKDLVPAEDRISDKYALNKNKTKLNRYYDKFRILTIDSINSIYKSVDIYLNGYNQSGVTSSSNKPTYDKIEQNNKSESEETNKINIENTDIKETTISHPDLDIVSAYTDSLKEIKLDRSTLGEYKLINQNDLTQNLIKSFSKNIIMTTTYSEKVTNTSCIFGGLGNIFENPVIITLVESSNNFQQNENDSIYFLYFYKNGANTDIITDKLAETKINNSDLISREAILKIECKKIISEEISKDSEILKNKINDNQVNKSKLYNLNIGEIVNIWLKD